MKPIDRSEVLPIGDYEAIRPHFRGRVIESKKRRRVALGGDLSAIFENRDTVLLQIQEMLRTERITGEAAIAHELETYNGLLPGPGQLSLTLFVEIAEKERRDQMLVDLAGLEESVALVVDGVRCKAVAQDRDGAVPGRTTAVNYMKIDVPADARAALAAGKPAALIVSHPRCEVSTPLDRVVVAQLVEDLGS